MTGIYAPESQRGLRMPKLTNGRYRARIAITKSDIRAAQRLRHLAFAPTLAATGDAADIDADRFDDFCTHVLVEEVATDRLVCCFRMLQMASGDEISRSYSAQSYDISALEAYNEPIIEMGRFCIHPQVMDSDVIRVAWAAMARYVDENNIKFMFGCVSFQGLDAAAYSDVFALLQQKYLAPDHYYPLEKARDIRRFCEYAADGGFDRRQALRQMPPLLRTYLAMGAWVSDHAVVDVQMNTLHVFIGLEISAIPPARKQLLRALAPA
ncbi:Putative hemolysin [hydrothermal vent metagenome]|uniref:Hemolysin n=1 Tax=hydrothermal vent metagenome TaxID=652676 RepID=A0A3B0SX33_9ZZZZ